MTVKQLIEKLMKFDETKEVLIDTEGSPLPITFIEVGDSEDFPDFDKVVISAQ